MYVRRIQIIDIINNKHRNERKQVNRTEKWLMRRMLFFYLPHSPISGGLLLNVIILHIRQKERKKLRNVYVLAFMS
jgi:hypothetical protein